MGVLNKTVAVIVTFNRSAKLMKVLDTFEAGTPLDGGGALAVFGTAEEMNDLIGR